MATWAAPTSVGKLILVDRLSPNGKRPGHRFGQRTLGATDNPVVLTDWHTRPQQKYESAHITLELQVSDSTVAAETDACNEQYAIARKDELFPRGTDALDIQSYYKPLCGDGNVLRLKLHKSETKVFCLQGGDMRRVAKDQLHKHTPVCVEVTDQGLWFNTEDQSWGPRWIVRNAYITGSPTGPASLVDDEFEDA